MNAKDLLREYVKEALILEEKPTKKKTPGGPRTDLGAVKQLNPGKFTNTVRQAVHTAHGDVSNAAQKLGVATRTMYHYLENEPNLGSVKTEKDLEPESSEGEETSDEKSKK